LSKRIEELKDLIDRAGRDGDWKGPYDELLRELYSSKVLFFALSKNDFDPDAKTSVPLISTKDFGGLPALYVFSEVGYAGLWLNHYRHVSEDCRYGLIAAVEKGDHGFFSIFKIAKKLGAEMVMLDEGGSYIGLRLDDLLEANGLDPSSIELPLSGEEMLDMLNNKVSPELRFARVPAIPLKGE
jgi:hypothetical protein